MTTLKFITALLPLTLILSCGHNSSGDNSYTAKGKNSDTLNNVRMDTAKADRWNFNKYLNDSRTPQLAKDIFNNTWKPKDDEPLEFLEKLHGQDKEARPFYFRVVTNSYKQSDGAYAEGLGNAGYEYVKNYPNEFSNYFVGQDAFSDNDLKTWADIVMLEFQIISENEYDKPLLENYLDIVRKNCKGCSVQQNRVIEKFSHYLNQRWRAFLKQIDG
jgi:hypothetical protein